MTFAQSVRISAVSAASTLAIIDRQSRKDLGKVIGFTYACYILATSPEAMQTYRSIWQLLQIIWAIVVWLFLLTQEWCDGQVTKHLPVEPVAVEVEQTAEVSEETIAADMQAFDSEPVAPVAVDWAKLSPYQLRTECSLQGIKWRGVKNGKHLSKRKMVEALGAIGLTA